MTTIVTRLYATEAQAVNAVKALTGARFSAADVNLVTPPDPEGAAPDNVEALILKGGVLPANVDAFAKAVRGGQSLVSVRAAWSLATTAIEVADRFEPVAGVSEDLHVADSWHAASPFSDFLGWPTLIDSKSSSDLAEGPAPFSHSLGLPSLSRARPFSALSKSDKAFSALAKSDKPFSKLIDKAAPFSGLFGLPVILKSRPRPRA
jgi:hypothetical protein